MDIEIPANETSVIWEIETEDNDFDDIDLLYSVQVQSPELRGLPPTYNSSPRWVFAHVRDNDQARITIEPVQDGYTEGETVSFTVTREGRAIPPLEIDVSVTQDNSSDQEDADFLTDTIPASVTIPRGQASVTLEVPTANDTEPEPHGAITAAITDSNRYRIGDPGSATTIIADNDRGTSTTSLSVSAESRVVEEGEDAVFVITRTGDTSLDVTARVQVTRVGQTTADDEDAIIFGQVHIRADVSEQEVAIAPGASTATLRLTTEDEELNDGNSSIKVALLLSDVYGIHPYPSIDHVWVRDNDIPTVTVKDPVNFEQVEDGVASPDFTLVRTGDTTYPLPIKRSLHTILYGHPRYGNLEVGDIDEAFYISQAIPAGETEGAFRFAGLRSVGPRGGVGTARVFPNYCETVPGECGRYASQYRVGEADTARVTVHNDAQGVEVAASQTSVEEGESITFTFTRFGGSPTSRKRALNVRVAVTQNGEFIQGTTPATVMFDSLANDPEGYRTATLTVETDDDALFEPDGSITLTILPTNRDEVLWDYEIGDGVADDSGIATVSVTDNDLPKISVADAEAQEDNGALEFTVTLEATDDEVRVDWATADGTFHHPATAGEDYTAASGTITFLPGQTSRAIRIATTTDTMYEQDESFSLALSNPVGGDLENDTATGTILNDDLALEINILSPHAPSGGTGEVTEGQAVFAYVTRSLSSEADDDVPRSALTQEDLTVDLEVTQTGDFVSAALPTSVTIPVGQLSAQLVIPTDDDEVFEPDGLVTIALQDRGDYGLGQSTKTMTAILDNDGGGLSIADAAGSEDDGKVTFTLSLNEALPAEATVEYRTVDGTATSSDGSTPGSLGKDFEPAGGTVTIPAGQTQATVSVTVLDDTFYEPDDEQFTIRLSNPSSNVNLDDTEATGTITDSDDKMVVGLKAKAHEFPENLGMPAPVVLQLAPAEGSSTTAVEGEVTVNWSLEQNTASAGKDYAAGSGTATFALGSLEATAEVLLIDDEYYEALRESFYFNLAGGPLVDLSASQVKQRATIVIIDDEEMQAVVSTPDSSVTEGGEASFTITLVGSRSEADTTVNYEISGTASEGDDYTGPENSTPGDGLLTGSLVVPAGARKATLKITTLDDNTPDPDETLIMTLTLGGTGAGANSRNVPVSPDPATVTILEAGVLSVSIEAGDPQEEGEPIIFTITLSKEPAGDVTVHLGKPQEVDQPNAATEGTDYTAPKAEPYTVEDKEKTLEISVPTIEDNLAEGDEVVSLEISRATMEVDGKTEDVPLGARLAVGTITDDDDPPTEITLAISPDAAGEDANPAAVRVVATLVGDSTLPDDLEVVIGAKGLTASDDDFTYDEITLTIMDGTKSAEEIFNIRPVDDLLHEPNETLQVVGAAGIDTITVKPAEFTIEDNDDRPTEVVLTLDTLSVREGDGETTLTVTATLQGQSLLLEDLEIPLTVDGVSLPAAVQGEDPTVAATDDDFSFTAATVTIPAGQLTGTVELLLTPTDDILAEGQETVQVNGTVKDMDVTGAPLPIEDNDQEPSQIRLSVTPISAGEEDGAVSLAVTAAFDGSTARTSDTPVAISLSDVTTKVGEDYTQLPATTVTIPAGDLDASVNVSLAILEDDYHEGAETLSVGGVNSDPGLPVAGVRFTIEDNDALPSAIDLSLSDDTIAEGDGQQRLTVTATFSGASVRPVDTRVQLDFVPGTASAADYSGRGATLTIAAGASSGTADILVTPLDDRADEEDETFEVRGRVGEQRLSITATATVTITDNDTNGITFNPTALTVREGGSAAYTVVLNAQPTGDVTVAVSGHASTVLTLGGLDSNDSLTFTATTWNRPQTVTVNAAFDTDDADGSLTLSHSASGGGYDGTTEDLAVTVEDLPSVTVSFGAATYTATEGSSVTVTARLSADPERTVAIPLSTTNQGGASDADYSGVPDSVAFNSGETSKTFTFTATDDADNDDGESVKLGFGTLPDGVSTGTTNETTVSITDNDDPDVKVSFGAAMYNVDEGGTVTVTVTLDADPERTVTIPLTGTGQNGATAGDFSIPASVEFNSGETSQTFTFRATDDSDNDDGESVKLAFGTLPSGVSAGTTNETTVSIADNDDPTVKVSFGAATYTAIEGGTAMVTVTLDADPERTVTIPLTGTGQNGATAGDFSIPASVTFNSGETSKTFTFSAADDDVDDDGEVVKLTFGTLPSGVTAGTRNETTVTITDTDIPAVKVSFGAATYTVDEGSTVTVTVTLDADPERTVTIPITKSNQGGASDADYSGVPASVTIDSGETSKTFTFTAVQDTVDDDGESVELGFGTLPARVTAGTTDTSTVNITDNDDPEVTVSFGLSAYSVAEGDDVSVTVSLSADPERTVTIPITKSNQGGASDADYSGVPASVTIDSGETSKTFTFTAVQDTVDDDGESVALGFGTLPARVTAGTTATATVSITDNDDPPVTVSFGLSAYSVAEGDDVTVTVTLSADPERTVTIPLAGTGQNGATAGDFSIPASVSFDSGETSKTFTFTATDDTVDDDDESVVLAFGTLPARVTAGTTATATVSITDNDDPAVTVSFGEAAYTVAEGGDVTVTVTLSADPERTVTIPLSKSNENGASNADYSGVPANVAFNSGETSKTFTFTATDDDVDDDGESVKLGFGDTLPHRVTAGTTAETVVSITDNDVPDVKVSFGKATYTAAEGSSVTVTVTLDKAPEREVVVPLSKTNQGGTSDADYSGVPASVTFSATQTSRTFTFRATDDDDNDNGESVKLAFGTLPTGVSAGTTSETTVSITDTDVPDVTATFLRTAYVVDEADDPDTTNKVENQVEIKVTLSAAPEREVVIPLTTSNQNGATDADYTGVPASLTFSATDTEQSFTFNAVNNDESHGTKTVRVSMGTLPAGVTVGDRNGTVVNILDDDSPEVEVSFGAATYTATEGGTATITVRLDQTPEREVTIPLTATNENGASDADYSGVPSEVTFSATETSRTFTFTATDDTDEDDGESVKLGFGGTLPHRVSAGSVNEATVNITDNDPAVQVSFGAATYVVDESDDAVTTGVRENEVTVTVSLDKAPQRTVVVTLSTTNENGASDTDYSGVPASVTFSATETSGTFTFTALDDADDDDGESVKLTFGALRSGVSTGTTGETTVSINDDDAPMQNNDPLDPQINPPPPPVEVGFGSASLKLAEGWSAQILLWLSEEPDADVTIPLRITEQGGVSSADYSGVPASVTFSSGSRMASFTFQATDDSVAETGETVVIGLGTLPGGFSAGSPRSTSILITDDTPAVQVSFGAASYTVEESDDTGTDAVQENEVEVTLTLDADPERTVAIPLTTTNQGGATSADYSGVPASVVFNSGETSKSFTFTATDDSDNDDGESVKLGFGTLPTDVTAGTTSEATVSITDNDDPAVKVSFGAATYTIDEADDPDTDAVRENQAVIEVRLSAAPERQVVVPLSKTNQGGASDADYDGVLDNVTFSATQTSKTFTFTAIDDDVDDDGESVKLGFGALPAGVSSGTPAETTVSINDNDVPDVKVSFGAATYTAAEGGMAMVTVSLDEAPERQVVVPLTKTNQDGASNADYSGVPASVTFSATDTSETFTFSATDDDDNDNGESVKLAFGTLPSGVSAGTTSEATVNITDTDVPEVTATFGQTAYLVDEADNPDTADEQENEVVIKVSLSEVPEREVVIPLSKSNHGGASDADYSGVPASLAFDSGDTEQTFTFTAVDNDEVNGGKSVRIDLGTLPAGVTEGGRPSTLVAIVDDETPDVKVSFGAAAYTAAEGGTATITVRLDQAPEREVVIPLTKANQGGASDADYSGVPSEVTFSATQTSRTFTFTAADDADNDDGESVKLGFGDTLPHRVAAGSVNEATVNITDTDVPDVSVSFGAAAYTAAEGGTATITVTLDKAPERQVVVPLSKTNQGGASNADYSGVPASVTFTATQTSRTFTFAATADGDDDDGESVKLGFGTLPSGVSAGTVDETTVSITDTDVPDVTATFLQASYTVDEADDPGTDHRVENQAVIRVSLSAAPEREVVIPLSRSNQNGATDADYTGVPASLTFSATDTEQSFTFNAVNNDESHGTKTVRVSLGTLPAGVSEGGRPSTLVLIRDDDSPEVEVSFGAATYTATEGGTATVTVRLDQAPEREVVIPLTKSNENGASDADYSGVPSEVTFSASQTSRTFTFTAADDDDNDDGETVKLGFGGTLPHRVTAGSVNEATVNITDTDVPDVSVSFGAATYTAAEGGTATITLTLDKAPERQVVVPLSTTNQDGATDGDYSGVPASVTFDSSDTSKTFTFSATDDDVDDDGESVKLAFGTLPAGVSAGTTDETTVSITDNDPQDPPVNLDPNTPTVSFGSARYFVSEGGTITVEVRLSEAISGGVTVPLTKTNRGGATAADYSGVPASVSFSSSETEKSFTFSATDDSVDDDGESVRLGFGALPTGVAAGAPRRTTVAIGDNDAPRQGNTYYWRKSFNVPDFGDARVSFGSGGYNVAEGGTTTIVVRLNMTFSSEITVPLRRSNQGGASNSDYSGVPDSITFGAGSTENSFTLTATSDTEEESGESVVIGFGNLPDGLVRGIPSVAYVAIRDQGVDPPGVECTVWCGNVKLGDYSNRDMWLELRYSRFNRSLDTYIDGDGFEHDGIVYRINIVELDVFQTPDLDAMGPYTSPEEANSFAIHIDQDTGDRHSGSPPSGRIADDWVLYFDGLGLPFSEATKALGGRMFIWETPDMYRKFLDWTPGTINRLRIENEPMPEPEPEPPGPPQQLEVLTGREQLFAIWNPPAREGTSPVTHYRIEWKESEYDWDDTANVMSATIGPPDNFIQTYSMTDGVTALKMYTVRVFAINEEGEGQPSVERTARTQDYRDAPRIVERRINGDSLTLEVDRQLDETAPPDFAARSFQVAADFASRMVTGVSVSGSTVEVTLEMGVTSASTVTMRYIPPTLLEQWALRDLQGNYVQPDLHLVDVINDSPDPAPPLTAQFLDLPDSHDGATEFTFKIRFSDWLLTYESLNRFHLLEVEGGRVERAWWMERDTRLWEVAIAPETTGDIVIRLPGGRDCLREAGAPCAMGGRRLSNTVEVTISGPDSPTTLNTPATGQPLIAGDAVLEGVLTADVSAITDEDGLSNVTFSYQWIRVEGGVETEIADATSASYTLTEDDEGKDIQVRVSFTDDAGNSETLTSPAVFLPADTNVPARGGVSITGTARVGSSLSADTSAVEDSNGLTGVAFSYQWLREQEGIETEIDGGATSEYTLADADAGQNIRVRVTFSDDDGHEETLDSAALYVPVPLTAELLALPEDHDGQSEFTFRVSFNLPVENPRMDVRDHFFSLTGATVADARRIEERNDLWEITVLPEGREDVEIELTGGRECSELGAPCDQHGSILFDSLTDTVPLEENREAEGIPVVDNVPYPGETLSVSTGAILDDNGMTRAVFAYQWLVLEDGSEIEIEGETGRRYRVRDGDAGKEILVRVSFTDDTGYEESATSAGQLVHEPLTANFTEFPAFYQGTKPFPARLLFNRGIVTEPADFRDYGIDVEGGSVDSAVQVDGRQDLWEITIRPGGGSDVYVFVDGKGGCEEAGTPCDEHGVRLSHTEALVVSPGQANDAPPGEEQREQREEQQAQEPFAPTNLTATVNPDGTVTLSWDAPDDDSITGYQILRRRPTEGEDTLLIYVQDTGSAAATFTDTGVTPGARHVYRVKAINSAGVGARSNYVNVDP